MGVSILTWYDVCLCVSACVRASALVLARAIGWSGGGGGTALQPDILGTAGWRC